MMKISSKRRRTKQQIKDEKAEAERQEAEVQLKLAQAEEMAKQF